MTWRLIAWSIFCTTACVHSPAQDLSATADDKVDRCRAAAGFESDDRFTKKPSADAVALCAEVAPGSPRAAAYIARALYVAGREEDAYLWIRLAVQADIPVAYTLEGVAHQYGFGVPEDAGEAIKSYRKASAAGQANGQFNLARILMKEGRPAADAWQEILANLNAAAAAGFARAVNDAAWLKRRGVMGVESPLSPLELYARAAAMGDEDAMFNWAVLSLDASPAQALEMLRTAAGTGHCPARILLADLHRHGRTVSRDRAEAVRLLQPCSEDYLAAWALGVLASDGSVADITAKQANELLAAAKDEMDELAKSRRGPAWHRNIGKEALPREELLVELVQMGNTTAVLQRRAASALRAHEIARRLGHMRTKDVLVDLSSSGHPQRAIEGARLLAEDLGLALKGDVEGGQTGREAPAPRPAPSGPAALRPAERIPGIVRDLAGPDSHAYITTLGRVHKLDSVSFEPIRKALILSRSPRAKLALLEIAKERRIPLPASIYEAAFDNPDSGIRSDAIRAAARNRLLVSTQHVAKLARDPSERVRKTLFSHAADAGWVLPAEVLVEAMEAAPSMANSAIAAAALNGAPVVRRQLLTMLHGGRSSDAASGALSRVRVGDEVGLFFQGLPRFGVDSKGERDYVIHNVVKTLEPARIAPFVEELLRSQNSRTRALGLSLVYQTDSQLHGEAATEMVAKDPDADVRRAAAEVLLNTWRPERIGALERATHDADGMVRARGLEGMKTDRDRYLRRAIELSSDADDRVRYRAVSTLRYHGALSSDAIQRLSADPDDSIRELVRDRDSPDEARADLKRWAGLPRPQRIDALCEEPGKHAMPALLELATDRGSSSDTRKRALHCAQALAGLHEPTEAQIALLGQILDDPTDESLDGFAAGILERAVSPGAARIVMRQAYLSEASICSDRNWISSFPDFARNQAAREFLLIPSQLVQQHGLECMGQRGLALYVKHAPQGRSGRLTPSEVAALTSVDGSEASTLLMTRLPFLDTDEQRLAMLEALWATRSDIAGQHALKYHGQLPATGKLFSAWAWALASHPSQASLDRLLGELPRADSGRQEAVIAAITLSSRLPSAELPVQGVAYVADLLTSNTTRWKLDDHARLFSPLAFLGECIHTQEPATHKLASEYLNNENVRVLAAHAAAIRRVLGQCVAWRASNGLPYPFAFEGIARKLVLSTGRVEEAAALGRAPDRLSRLSPMSALVEAEVESRLGNHSVVLRLLEHIEHGLLPHLAEADGSEYYFLRIAWLRGQSLAALGRSDDAVQWLSLAAEKGGRNSTGLLATAELIRYGVPPVHKTARWMLGEFELRGQSGPPVESAMRTITEHLIEREVERIDVEQSLLDADRLAAFSLAGLKAAPASLRSAEKSAAVRQLVELERRIEEAKPMGAKAVADARQRMHIWLADMRLKFPSMTDFLRPQRLQVEQLRESLGADTALVQYLLLPTRAYAWIISSTAQKVVRLDVTLPRLYATVATIRSGIASASTQSAEYKRALRELSDLLVAPVLESTTSTHWVIVPHSWLHGVPFSALSVGNAEAPLVSRVTISMASSAAAVMRMSRPRPQVEISELLAIGGATEFVSSLPELKFAKREVESIAALSTGYATVKTGAEATRTLLLAPERTTNRSLHLAIHAQALQADQSRLVFADGYLSVRDIWGLPLGGTPRVVLSACESGLGEALTGNDVLSLASAFQAAGAQSVVSSLWLIRDDERVGHLMLEFYASLNRGRSTAQALADAQRAAIAAGLPPNVWAAFVAHGL